jgi:hypothetical protein
VSAAGCVEIACCIAFDRAIANGRVMVAGRGGKKRPKAIGRVVKAACVCKKGSPTSTSVGPEASCGVSKCLKTVRSVVVCGGIAKERNRTGGGVLDAGSVRKKRRNTVGRVVGAGGEVEKSVSSLRGVVAWIAPVGRPVAVEVAWVLGASPKQASRSAMRGSRAVVLNWITGFMVLPFCSPLG